ncbi:holo-ACP synthase [Rathayibacter sp. YIM 133350]|uniref:holo-ACP synthase n=1 Tax=Rathayibacter sp. YIM 133350 TaxID=3131992 RepID=UPI00307EC41B
MIAAIGVDVVDLARFERAIARTPGLVDRLFAESEQGRHPRSLAARFAAKEALIKALGGDSGLRWHDMVIVSDEHGDPAFELTGTVAAIAARRGVRRVHVSMSHDAGIATAFVVTETDAVPGPGGNDDKGGNDGPGGNDGNDA